MVRSFGFNAFALITAAVAMSASSVANAAVVYGVGDGAFPLSNLAGTDNSLQVGDKIFDNFEYVATGDMPSVNNVMIQGIITNVNGTDMWGFRLVGAFLDSNAPGGSDALVTYDVNVVDPAAFLIESAYIAGNPKVIGVGQMSVVETFIPLDGDPSAVIYDIDGLAKKFTDQVFFAAPVAGLSVQKDIQAFIPNGSFGNLANMSFVDQLFTQIPGTDTGVPEPASLGVLALGAVGLIARRRR
jgi:hypothetical protein